VTSLSRDNGVAMVIAMMALMLMTALASALVLNMSSETIISTNYRGGSAALYAADAIVERALDDLLTVANWDQLLTGSVRSAFVDGAPNGVRRTAGGATVDLSEVVNMANCGKPSACSATDLTGNATGDRPWAANNPVWQLYAYGPLADMLPFRTIDSPLYVVLMVADDPSEDDGLPLQDGQLAGHPGRGVIALRAEAFGPRGAHKTIEVTVSRTDTTELERGYTSQRGQDEQNRRQRTAPAASPGGGLTMTVFDLSGGIR
jgi:hypothetical protein